MGVSAGELPRYEGKARRVVDRAAFADVAPVAALRVAGSDGRGVAAKPVAR